MKRSRLAALLGDEARQRGIDVRHDSRVLSARTSGDGAAVVIEDGTRLEADLVVGADGVHSRIRRAIDPGAPDGRYVGLTNFGGITRATSLAQEIAPEAWHFVFGRRAFFGYHRTPDGDVVWFVNVPRDEITREERATTTLEQWKQWLRGTSPTTQDLPTR